MPQLRVEVSLAAKTHKDRMLLGVTVIDEEAEIDPEGAHLDPGEALRDVRPRLRAQRSQREERLAPLDFESVAAFWSASIASIDHENLRKWLNFTESLEDAALLGAKSPRELFNIARGLPS